jgi:tRNA threonylcarbamoyladenosine modification (KEOPS) complex Cgi121 subunit
MLSTEVKEEVLRPLAGVRQVRRLDVRAARPGNEGLREEGRPS